MNQLADSDIVKKLTILTNKKQELIDKKPIDFVNKGLKENMTRTLSQQGFTKEQIEEKIIEMGKQTKIGEISKIETKIKEI